MAVAQQSFADVYRKEKDRIEVQLKQLLPLTVEKVIHWGDKPLGYIAKNSAETTNLIREVSAAGAMQVLEDAMKSIGQAPSLMSRLLSRSETLAYKPKLLAIQSNMQRWIDETNRLLLLMKKTENQLSVAMVTFASVAIHHGNIPDQMLDVTVNQRRGTLQQATMQAQMLVNQLESQFANLMTTKNTLDHFLSVTLPAYEGAR